MKPYYERGGITIYHADCREVLPTLEAGSVDAVITDPPFKLSQTYTANVDADNLSAVCSIYPVSQALYRVCADGAYLGMFYDTRILPLAFEAMRWAGWKYLRGLTFYRRWGVCNKLYGWMSSSDFVLIFRKPTDAPYQFYSTDWRHDVYTRDAPEADYYDHPARKPLGPVSHMVGHLTPPGGLLVDPFSGSGTTLLAAANTGRRAIGIEIEERYCEIAARRLSQDVLPLEGVAV